VIDSDVISRNVYVNIASSPTKTIDSQATMKSTIGYLD